MENKPISDAELVELDRLHAAAPSGTWVVGRNKASGRVQIHNGQHQVCAVWHTAAHPARETAEAIAFTHNALPGIFALIEDLQAYRDEVEAAKPTVQALLDSGERAASEAADLRQRLTDAERERQRLHDLANRLLDANTGLIDTIRNLDPEALCDWHDSIGGDEYLQQWLADRDARMKREGAAEWLEAEVERAKQSSRVGITYERDYFEQAAKRLREGGE